MNTVHLKVPHSTPEGRNALRNGCVYCTCMQEGQFARALCERVTVGPLWSLLIKERIRATIDLSRCNAISTSNEGVTRDDHLPLHSHCHCITN